MSPSSMPAGFGVAKTLTTISDPSIGTLNGVRTILDDIGQVEAVTLIHATTLVTNGILERKGAKVGLITTAGFRDVLEIGREPRYDLFDLNLDKPAPLVPRSLRHEVRERILADGEIAVPLDADDVRRAAGLLREAECEAVAVVLLHAYRNSAHELKVAAILREEFPELDVSISSDVAPEIGEYVRTSTTVANAYVRPMVRSYVQRLNAEARGRGPRRAAAADAIQWRPGDSEPTSSAIPSSFWSPDRRPARLPPRCAASRRDSRI